MVTKSGKFKTRAKIKQKIGKMPSVLEFNPELTAD
jgi:hypothetical protein